MEHRGFQQPWHSVTGSTLTRQLRISGRVQGVGYRDALCWEAERLGVTGWVRNRSDGSVEALVQGETQAVESLIAWARQGPRAARVLEVTASAPGPEFDRAYARFERWPSA
jgi:acylphosphatase